MESINAKRYLSALENEVDAQRGDTEDTSETVEGVGRPRPEGAEHLPPPLPPRIDKVDINAGKLQDGERRCV